MTRSSGRALTGRLPSARAGASSRVIDHPGPLSAHQPGRERAPVALRLGGGHRAVAGRRLLGEPLHLRAAGRRAAAACRAIGGLALRDQPGQLRCTSPARRSVPWAVRPEVANSSPAARATTGTSTVQRGGRRPEAASGATLHLLGPRGHRPDARRAGDRAGRRRLLVLGSLGWGQFTAGATARPPEGVRTVPKSKVRKKSVYTPPEGVLQSRAAQRPRRPAEPALVRPADGRPDGARPAVDRRLLRGRRQDRVHGDARGVELRHRVRRDGRRPGACRCAGADAGTRPTRRPSEAPVPAGDGGLGRFPWRTAVHSRSLRPQVDMALHPQGCPPSVEGRTGPAPR